MKERVPLRSVVNSVGYAFLIWKQMHSTRPALVLASQTVIDSSESYAMILTISTAFRYS